MLWDLYNVLFAIGYTLMLPRFLWRMWRRGGYRKGFLQRFACYSAEIREKLAAGPRRIWIHAVSVGEVLVALRFLRELRRQRTEHRFVLSTTTSTGYALAKKHLGDDDILVFFPVDFPFVLRRVLRTLNPLALILTECELWPNLIRLLASRNVPVILINGRISDSSFRGYRKIRFFLAPVLARMELFLVQTATDRDRLIALGARPERVVISGSAKYDEVEADPDAEARVQKLLAVCGFGADDPILLGGSTWPGEESTLMDIFRELKPRMPSLRLILVPRHVERTESIERELHAKGLTSVRRSDLGKNSGPARSPPDVLLVDTTGELKVLYTAGTVIFVGKSLTCHGGQNVIEAALAGKPILVGPYTENFEDVVRDFQEARAIIKVQGREELRAAIERLLADAREREAMGLRARQLVEKKRGIVKRGTELIARVLLAHEEVSSPPTCDESEKEAVHTDKRVGQ
ncbi:MAG: 3-deoxy-D-manno-octulosonic acid transferase [Kiritimatiellia bacterium]